MYNCLVRSRFMVYVKNREKESEFSSEEVFEKYGRSLKNG